MKFEKIIRPERIIQFGEGGFLRGFVDWMIQKMNNVHGFNGNIVIVQPIENGMCDVLEEQNCVYTHITRGKEWVEKENVFTNTLVDRINTGYSKEMEKELDYKDRMLNTSERFHLWVIETAYDLLQEMDFASAGLNIV